MTDRISLEEFNPDMQLIADAMYLGPQGEILSLLDNFNNSYTNFNGEHYPDRRPGLDHLEITKKFRWKPGTYDKIKRIYEHYVLRWQVRPSNAQSIFDRKRAYYETSIRNAIKNIEEILIEKRREGVVWSEDVQEVVDDFATFKSDLENQLNTTKDYILSNNNQDYIECYIDQPDDPNLALEDQLKRTKLTLMFYFDKLDLNYRDRGGNIIQVIPGHPMAIRIQMNLLKLFNQFHNNKDWKKMKNSYGRRNNLVELRGKISPVNKSLHHPYIGRRYGHEGDNWQNVCTGDLTTTIVDPSIQANWITTYHALSMWLGEYICGYTGPLNPPNTMHLGVPKSWNSDYIDRMGIRTEWCSDAVESGFDHRENLKLFNHNYCKEIDCQIMDRCTGFKVSEERLSRALKLIPTLQNIKAVNKKAEIAVDETYRIYELLKTLYKVQWRGIDTDKEGLFNLLLDSEWIFLIKNRYINLIRNVFSLDDDWYKQELPVDDEETTSVRNEMLTWATSINRNIAVD
jgi:hypothetical protein